MEVKITNISIETLEVVSTVTYSTCQDMGSDLCMHLFLLTVLHLHTLQWVACININKTPGAIALDYPN